MVQLLTIWNERICFKSIPQWNFVFINEDVTGFSIIPSWWRHESKTDKSTSCITHIYVTMLCIWLV